MTLEHRLNLARNIFLDYARRRKCDRPNKAIEAVQIADAIDAALEQITLLETAMRTANEAVKSALDALRASRKEAADATAALNAAKADGILNDENTAGLNELVPEVVVEGQA
jgi:hypothetical protein